MRDKNGKMITSVTIEPGTEVIVPIKQWNLDERIFGPDAKMFKPERWLGDSGQALSSNTSAKRVASFPPLMTFIGGVRNCPGARFAFLEIKSVMFAFIGRFEIAERDEGGTEFVSITAAAKERISLTLSFFLRSSSATLQRECWSRTNVRKAFSCHCASVKSKLRLEIA